MAFHYEIASLRPESLLGQGPREHVCLISLFYTSLLFPHTAPPYFEAVRSQDGGNTFAECDVSAL